MDFQRKKVCGHLLGSENLNQNVNSNFYFGEDTAPALMNDVILRHMFQFLDISDFKNCRLVCSKWKSVGDGPFKKRVQIFLDFKPENDDSDETFSPATSVILQELKNVFKNAREESPFKALRLSGHLPWTPLQLSDFFSKEGKFITHLTFLDVALSDNKEEHKIMERYELAKLTENMLNLSHLKIREYNDLSCAENSTRFVLRLEDLSRIQSLHLEGCEIDLFDKQILISPVALHLQSVAFYKDNFLVKDLFLNDIVNLSAVKNLTVRSYSYEPRPSTMMILNCVGKVKLQNLSLIGGLIQNFENSSWEINAIDLWNVPFVQKTKLKSLKEFAFGNSECDFSCLPTSIEKLTMSYGIKSSQLENISLPHVKSLNLDHADCVALFLPCLNTKFSNIEKLSLQGSSSENANYFVNLDVNRIPNSVKEMCIQYDGINFIGDRIVTLDKLVLIDVRPEFVKTIQKYFYVKHLVIN